MQSIGRHFSIVLSFFVGSCGITSLSTVRSVKVPDLAIKLETIGAETFLYVGVVQTATTLTVTASSATGLETISMTDFAKLGNGRHIFKSQPFTPRANVEISIQAVGVSTYQRKIQFYVDDSSVSQFGSASSRKLTIVGSETDGLANPRDLEFNPKNPSELWTVNKDSEGVVIFHNAGTPTQRSEKRADAYKKHFMAKVSSLAFGTSGSFATCHESRNEFGGARDFMGPSLWSSDLSIFAAVNQNMNDNAICDGRPTEDLQGSHLDMLHQSPLCMGIAHISENQYWAFDGAKGELVHYDFAKDHGPGRSDHSDGKVRRYSDVKVVTVVDVPSHMVVDSVTGFLYVANTGTGSILKVDAKAATKEKSLQSRDEPLAEYSSYKGAQVSTFAQGLRQPSGIAIADKKLFVSDHATGEIVAFNLETGAELGRISTGAKKIMGLTVSASSHLWYVDAGTQTVVRIDP